MLWQVSVLYSCLWLNDIPLNIYSTIGLSNRALIDIWIRPFMVL